MKSILPVFLKVLSKEFYRTNAGFFLMVVGICFGFLRGIEHVALGQYFVSSPMLLMIPIAVWMLYAIKIMLFNDLSFRKDTNQFLYQSATLPAPVLLTTLTLVTVQQLLPAILYGIFLSAMAIQADQLHAVPEIILALCTLATLIIAKQHRSLKHPSHEKHTSAWVRRLSSWLTRPYVIFYPEWIARAQPMMVFGTKIFSSLLIIGVCRLYLFDSYDERLFNLGCTLAFSFNALLVFYYHRFETFYFTGMRCMPIPLLQRLGYFIIILVLLQAVEIGTLVNYRPAEISLGNTFAVIVFGLSINLLSYSYLYIRDRTLESYVNRLFLMVFIWILLILFRIPVLAIAMTQGTLAYILYRKYFYGFEFNAAVNSEK